MKEVYRIKKGKLYNENYEIPIDFGLVFSENGVLHFDLYINESFNLHTLMKKEEQVFLYQDFSLHASTEENNLIDATELSARNVIPHMSKVSMQSSGYLSHTEVRPELNEEEEKETEDDKRQTLYYLELEGLKMKFSDMTQTTRARRGVKIDDFKDWERDHTSAMLIYDGNKYSRNNFELTFFKNTTNDNITVSFPNYRDNGPNILHYDVFQEFKRDLIFLLSFLNGAEIKIRKEYIGGFYNIGTVNSQTVITYSFKDIAHERYSDYVPLNNSFHRGDNILNHVLIKNFNKFVEINKSLDLNSIIFYLNGSEQSSRIEEKFFIQIIAFERLAQKYIEKLDETETFIIPDEDYKLIKKDLYDVLDKHSKLLGDKKNVFCGKIGALHKAKGAKYKFIKLLEYANIQITPDIQDIIDRVRHKTIHHGEIGIGSEGVKNYLVLDQLLRDIILNIIGYDRVRISHLRQNKPEVAGL